VIEPRIKLCSPSEAAAYIASLTASEAKALEREPPRIDFQGHVDLVCREETGEIAWEVHQHNVVTNYFRRAAWFNIGLPVPPTLAYQYLVIGDSLDPARADRNNLIDGNGVGAVSLQLTGASDGGWGKSWTNSFAAPGASRRIGAVGLSSAADGWFSGGGMNFLLAYTQINPYKTQSTTQTLEVVYKITLNYFIY